MRAAIKNAVEFPTTLLKCIEGVVPNDIEGSYFRNGPAVFKYGSETLDHWFHADGGILKLSFRDGKCNAEFKIIKTPNYLRRSQSKLFHPGYFSKLWKKLWEQKRSFDAVNTSVLLLKNKPDVFYGLVESSVPFAIKKQNLEEVGFQDFGWISSAFSAHPKIDPKTGEVFNIGMNMPSITLSRSTADMKPICQNNFRLKNPQPIHDCCLAGDFFVFFEYPVIMSLKQLLTTTKFAFNCMTYDEKLPILVHIFKKETLEHVKTIETGPGYVFHFTNGFSNEEQIVLEYVKYHQDCILELLEVLRSIPKYSQGQEKIFKGRSSLIQMRINLKDFTHQVEEVDINGEFPVCQDEEVSSPWRYTYIVGSQQKENQEFLKHSTLYKYDRQQKKKYSNYLGDQAYLNEPFLVRTQKQLYILSVVNENNAAFIDIFAGDDLKRICRLELPESVPPGFHGKWDKA